LQSRWFLSIAPPDSIAILVFGRSKNKNIRGLVLP